MNFIEANGVSLRYVVEGIGKPIVLIHEMGGTLESWGLLAPLLASQRRVIRYDTRGAGFSEKVRGTLSIDTMTDDLVALLDALGITEKVALAGTAVGGAIALHTAFRHPDRVAAVIVSSPATSIPAENRAAVLGRIDAMERDGMRSAFDATATNSYPPELRTDMARYEGFKARWLANDATSYAAIYRMLVHMDLADELPRITCPALVIGGKFDRGRPPARVEPIAKAIPGAHYKVLPVGHYAGLQKPEIMAREIGEFLESVGA
jgi:3-oxoadipate enol-lactonase